MDYLRRCELRWQISLKWWLVSCFILSEIFYTIAGVSTIILAKTHGIWIEANPTARIFFENLGIVWGSIALEIIGLILIAVILFRLSKHGFPFLTLFAAHVFLITFFFVSLNDFSYIASGGLGEILSLFRIFGIYPWNILVFLALSFISTLMLTTDRKNKETP